MNKNKDSKNLAVLALRRGEGVVLALESGARECIYPAEFLAEGSRFAGKISENKTAIALAKRAGLLPILAVVPENNETKNWAEFSEIELKESLSQSSQIIETARANLPIEGAEDSKLVSFRELGDEAVHLALIIGKPQNKEQIPLVRAHSSCVTGDLLGSLRCDCGGQLQMALSAIKSSGYGVLLYLNQEGRGIGITNKIRAYVLQEKGMDTYEANHALGFGADERDFSVASEMLSALGIRKIRLLSNNPHKMAALEKLGVEIVERVPLIAPAHEHNKNYLLAKGHAGHLL